MHGTRTVSISTFHGVSFRLSTLPKITFFGVGNIGRRLHNMPNDKTCCYPDSHIRIRILCASPISNYLIIVFGCANGQIYETPAFIGSRFLSVASLVEHQPYLLRCNKMVYKSKTTHGIVLLNSFLHTIWQLPLKGDVYTLFQPRMAFPRLSLCAQPNQS